MIGVEEVLPVVAFGCEAGVQQVPDQPLGLGDGAFAHLFEQQGIMAQIVRFDVVAIDAQRQLELLFLDGVIVLGDVLDHTVTDPFAHVGHLAQPTVLLFLLARLDAGSDLVGLRLGGRLLTFLHRSGIAGAQGSQIGAIDDHGSGSLSA